MSLSTETDTAPRETQTDTTPLADTHDVPSRSGTRHTGSSAAKTNQPSTKRRQNSPRFTEATEACLLRDGLRGPAKRACDGPSQCAMGGPRPASTPSQKGG